MATKQKTLQDAFYETLKDVYYAEKQSVKALKKSAKAAEHDELRQAFETHAEESANQVERLQQVFEIIGKPARAKTCEAMQGLTSEMEEDLEDFGDSPAADCGAGRLRPGCRALRDCALWHAERPGRPSSATPMPPSYSTRPCRRRRKPIKLLSQIAEKINVDGSEGASKDVVAPKGKGSRKAV